MPKILYADDEVGIRKTVFDYMTAKGFEVTTVANGEAAVRAVANDRFDLIILDVMMPVMNGMEACREIRRYTEAPILFLSALGQEQDLLSGYRSGGDDYIIKPYPLSVLCEKCNSMILRHKGANKEGRITAGGLTLDTAEMRVYSAQTEYRIGGIEFRLLEYLMQNKGIALDRERILNHVWSYAFDGDLRVVDSHIKALRKALGDKKTLIKTVFNTGYKFEEDAK